MNKIEVQNWTLALIITVIIIAIHCNSWSRSSLLTLHIDESPTSTYFTNKHINETILDHNTKAAFKRRIITNGLINGISSTSVANKALSFIFITFLFLFLSGLMVQKTAYQLTSNIRYSRISMIFFFVCFPNIFLLYPPQYTYDDPLHYFVILTSFLLFAKNKYWLGMLAFFVSMLIRESSIILIPGVVIWLTLKSDKRFNFKRFVIESIKFVPALILFAFTLYLIVKGMDLGDDNKSDVANRFDHWRLNFLRQDYAIESMYMIWLVIGLPTLLLIKDLKNKNLGLITAYIITLIINTFVVITMTKVRESRLLFLPILFLIPLLGEYLSNAIKHLKAFFKGEKDFQFWKIMVLYVFIMALNFVLVLFTFRCTVNLNVGYIYSVYLFLYNAFIVALVLFKPALPFNEES